MTDLLATATIAIDSPADAVWSALTEPDVVRKYMFGTIVRSTFQVGAPITWSGEFEGTSYEDHGTVMAVDERERLQVTHFSPLSGRPDVPENYHTLTYTLQDNGHRTLLTLTQDNKDSPETQAHSEQNWSAMLVTLKEVVEAPQ